MINNPTKIILHCSDTPDHMDIGVSEIRTWHVRDNGWRDVGYHYVIRRNGTVELGRDESVIGAHCHGHNTDSLGICWVGRDDITTDQVQSLCNLFCNIRMRWLIPSGECYGHAELDPMKTCPRLPMPLVRFLLRESAVHGF